MPKPRQRPYLKTAIYGYFAPADGVTTGHFAASSWKNTTTGTYDGVPNDARTGIQSGALGNPQIGGYILGANAEVYQKALKARGRNVDTTDNDSCWQTQIWSGPDPGGTTSKKKNLAGGANVNDGVCVYGEGLVDLCSMYDLVILGDFPPAELIQDIKRRSRRPGGTKVVLGLLAVEAIAQYRENNSIWEPVRAIQKGRLLKSNVAGTNATPSTYCIQTEAPGYTGSTSNSDPPADDNDNAAYSWISDFIRENPIGAGTLTYLASLESAMVTALDTRYPPGLLDGVMFDNVLDQCFFGTATNRPATIGSPPGGTGSDAHPAFVYWCNSVNYRYAWKTFLTYLNRRLTFAGGTELGSALMLRHGGIWGNTGGNVVDATYYSHYELSNRFCEFMMHASAGSPNPTTLAQIRANLRYARERRMRLCGGILRPANGSAVNAWCDAGSQGGRGPSDSLNWSKVLNVVRDFDMLDDFYVLGARTSTGGIIHWDPAFGPVA